MDCLDITVQLDQRVQTIHSFGACDAWTPVQIAGFDEAAKCAIARLLFDNEQDEDGRPVGIGLSGWRVLLGAGSADSKCVSIEAHRTECYLRTDFSCGGQWIGAARPARRADRVRDYRYERCPEQQWFVKQASKRVTHLVASVHSPPISLTANGRTNVRPRRDGELTCNLRHEQGGLFSAELADFVREVLWYFKSEKDVHFSAVTPVNEPHWPWDTDDREGCAYSNSEVMAVVQDVAGLMDDGVVVGAPDAGALDYLVSSVPGREQHSNFVSYLTARFGERQRPPLRAVTGHSYYTCWPAEDALVGVREELARQLAPLQERDVQYWMTEYCVRIPADQRWVPIGAVQNAPADDLGRALWAARVVHMDLTICNASAWYWWLAMSVGSSTDGLIQVYPGTEGHFRPTKQLYALGNWSHYVRPGMQRLRTQRSDGLSDRESAQDVMVSAFHDHRSGRIVCVIVNYSGVDRALRVHLDGTPNALPEASTFSLSVTSDTANLEPYATASMGQPFRVPRRSVVSCCGEVVRSDVLYNIVSIDSYDRADGRRWCLQVLTGSVNSCAVVGLGERGDGVRGQRWSLRAADYLRVYVRVCAEGTTHCLDVFNASCDPSATLQLSRTNQTESQDWRIERTPAGFVYLVARHSGHVLEVVDREVRMNVRRGAKTQLWLLLPAGEPDRSRVTFEMPAEGAGLGREWTDSVLPAPAADAEPPPEAEEEPAAVDTVDQTSEDQPAPQPKPEPIVRAHEPERDRWATDCLKVKLAGTREDILYGGKGDKFKELASKLLKIDVGSVELQWLTSYRVGPEHWTEVQVRFPGEHDSDRLTAVLRDLGDSESAHAGAGGRVASLRGGHAPLPRISD
eukprot:TRINITY_DN26646_c0_g1_i1.p1 TRINITY_DN26646_c0_g1~~TRINITY_DN26646_c0_g1_i1.p1  ORF type:complete len:856 (+),score=225.59 TRINITY_DN26646_c0_g1_i1:37-2604(+)